MNTVRALTIRRVDKNVQPCLVDEGVRILHDSWRDLTPDPDRPLDANLFKGHRLRVVSAMNPQRAGNGTPSRTTRRETEARSRPGGRSGGGTKRARRVSADAAALAGRGLVPIVVGHVLPHSTKRRDGGECV